MSNRNLLTESIIWMVLAWIQNTVPVTTVLFSVVVDYHLIYQVSSMALSFTLRFTCFLLLRLGPPEPIKRG